MRALVYGLAVTGVSTVRALQRHGWHVDVCDDHVDDDKQDLANTLGVELLPLIDAQNAPRVFANNSYDLLSPAPGVPESHPVIVAALGVGVPVMSEIELAYRWEQERAGGPRPILAITGTDGKTTTTEMTVAMLRAAGVRTEALGNTDTPLLDAIDLTGDDELDAFVVECTSFRLAWTQQFRADAAVWLNLAPDHLNWHTSLESYIDAKARIFELQRSSDVAIGFVDDAVVVEHLAVAPARQVTFGATQADYRLESIDGRSMLVGPQGVIAAVDAMRRSLPHDLTNALAASALVLETGLATPTAIQSALADFSPPRHRLELVAEAHGVTWFNDSKATTPHAASTAIRAFKSMVLIAGGSRKGVDLTAMGSAAAGVRAVVAIGEAAPDIHAVFDSITTVTDAPTMVDAVRTAAELARPGDAIVLSPGCASFDWYSGYPARGDDFVANVRELLASQEALS
jgi:UDP-N-acetylmuramoylalanine--D-glutamate ligase